MSRRRWPWVLLVVIASAIALQIYDTRPHTGIPAEADAYTAKLAADPATAPAERAELASLHALAAVSAAPDLVLQDDQRWREQRVPLLDGTTLPNVLSADRRAAALDHQAGLWRAAMARRPDADELARRCVYEVPYAPCAVRASGEVPGSGGALRWQASGRYLAEGTGPDADKRFEADEAAGGSDPMVGGTIDIFAPDPAGGWRMVLAFQGEAAERPTLVSTPAGPLLVVTGDSRLEPALYAEIDGRWRYLYQAAWLQGLADKAPPGSCLDGGFYLGDWPWAKHLIPELTRTRLDVATLSVDAAYFADGHKVALVHATVAPRADELVLRTADVKVLGPVSLWTRLFGRCHG